ncbi:Sm-like protein lsm7 [Serendipita sp. 398]|nr:Sm-like protein lsm7 [Serendipita sp. 398]
MAVGMHAQVSGIVVGILKGFDQLLNLVLDQVEEEQSEIQQTSRVLGLAVVRGPTVTLITPADGYEEIADPFAET